MTPTNSLANFPKSSIRRCRDCGGEFIGGTTAFRCPVCRERIKVVRRAQHYYGKERSRHISKGFAVDPPMEGESRCARFAELDRLIEGGAE